MSATRSSLAEHLRAVGVVAAGLLPKVGGLEGGHEDFLRADAVLFLADDLGDAAQDAPAGGQPGVDAGGGLPDQAGAEHEPVGGDLGVGRGFLERGHEAVGQAHGGSGRWVPCS